MIKSYKLSKTAAAQLEDIITCTDETFGEAQADAYAAGFVQSFELLVGFPGIGAAAFEIKQGWRRYRFQSHHIFYSQQTDHIAIEAILHVARNIGPDLFDT